MDSQLYVVINPDRLIGQTVSKGLARQGNTVVYLSENESIGYAVTAEEPRVRFRHCNVGDRCALEGELVWIEECISAIDGIIVMMSDAEFSANSMPFSQPYFKTLPLSAWSTDKDISITYVITPSCSDEEESFRELHLSLCEQVHHSNQPCTGALTHYIMLPQCTSESKDDLIQEQGEEAAKLIHYLASSPLKGLANQAFYFDNFKS